jgi:quinol monooxygenase YgiN
MKPFKFFAAFSVALSLFLFFSCNSGDQKKADDATATADTAAKVATPPPAPPVASKPANVLLVWHKVANFDKWLALYESHDSVRMAYGLHNYVVARNTTDPNMLMVALHMDDAAKAKQFTELPDLKAAMQKGGVMGAPKFAYIDVQMVDTSANASERVMRMVKVKDYDAWKKGFDTTGQMRMDAGLKLRTLGYTMGDNHNVTIVYAVSDKKKAEAYFNSPALQERMKTAGVEGTPETFWYTVAKKY